MAPAPHRGCPDRRPRLGVIDTPAPSSMSRSPSDRPIRSALKGEREMVTTQTSPEVLEREANLYTMYLEACRAGKPVDIEALIQDLPEDRRPDMRKALKMA